MRNNSSFRKLGRTNPYEKFGAMKRPEAPAAVILGVVPRIC
ncbi:hypothetical protein EDF70_102242 [Neorhizobium sp. JUb45]|nr:hypothetical protein EDF70_102242 [Neorhizobium sp. JUb45]